MHSSRVASRIDYFALIGWHAEPTRIIEAIPYLLLFCFRAKKVAVCIPVCHSCVARSQSGIVAADFRIFSTVTYMMKCLNLSAVLFIFS